MAEPDLASNAPADAPLQLDRQLCFAVYVAAHAYARLYKPLLDPMGLTHPQYLVMLVLWEGDGQTVSAIGRRLMLDSGTLTPLLKRLEAAGLVSRQRDARDERQVRITLTDTGADLRAQAQELPQKLVAAFGGSADEADTLRGTLTELRRRLNRTP